MKLLFSLAVYCLAVSSSLHAQPGFLIGDTISIHVLRGQVDLTCRERGRDERHHIYCDGFHHDPDYASVFALGEPFDAESIVFLALHENGKKSSAVKYSFDTETGQTKQDVNLTAAAVLRPKLLSYGKNIVSYSLQKDKVEVGGGSLEFQVNRGENRRCRPRYYRTWQECRHARALICNDYFEDENLCRY